MEIEKLKERMICWAREMGEIQKKAFQGEEIHFQIKSTEIDLVTQVDMQCEFYIQSKIKEHYPTHNILSEESAPLNQQSSYTWVIDPLDGTGNFAHKFPIFCVSIGVLKDGEGLLSVVYVPCLEECFVAERGKGAFLNGRKINVRTFEGFSSSLLATGFPYDRKTTEQNNVNYFQRLITEVRGIRRTGAAAYDLACVAAGRFTGYWELGIKPWDLAAGKLLIEEAGGVVRPLEGKREVSVVAGSAVFVDAFLEKTKGL